MPNSGSPEELFIRLYLDCHVIVRLADDLMERGYDVLTTQQAGLDTKRRTTACVCHEQASRD
jgi:hypothetical protein